MNAITYINIIIVTNIIIISCAYQFYTTLSIRKLPLFQNCVFTTKTLVNLQEN